MRTMAESYIKEINAIPRSFSKIIFGTAALKKPEKVYASFHIPSNENIVAYIKSSVPFLGQTTVITDYALYTYLHKSIPFSDICKYLIFQADPKAAVSISDGTESQDILGGTILSKTWQEWILPNLSGNYRCGWFRITHGPDSNGIRWQVRFLIRSGKKCRRAKSQETAFCCWIHCRGRMLIWLLLLC